MKKVIKIILRSNHLKQGLKRKHLQDKMNDVMLHVLILRSNHLKQGLKLILFLVHLKNVAKEDFKE